MYVRNYYIYSFDRICDTLNHILIRPSGPYMLLKINIFCIYNSYLSQILAIQVVLTCKSCTPGRDDVLHILRPHVARHMGDTPIFGML
jgi:hypothetical protein